MAAHEGLVTWVVRRQKLGPLSFAEARQAGRIGLWHALQRFDPSRDTRFSSYAVKAISRAIWKAIDAAGRARRAADRPVPAAVPGPAGDADRDPAALAAALLPLLAGLPPRLREVVLAHHGLDGSPPRSFAALGRAWGISRQRVHQLHVRALLLLAQPATSRDLRAVVGRQRRADYRRALARQRHAARRRRKGRP
jgi:RNA polymerase sigma factor (sigma-70 family)